MFKFSYSESLYYKSKLKLLGFPVLGITLGLIILYYSVPLLFKSTIILFGVVAFYSGYFIYPYMSKKVRLLDEKFDTIYEKFEEPLLKNADNAKRGMDGEATVKVWLKELLPENQYTIFSNLVLPDCKSDIDFVVIGPKGLFVFEVKNYSAQLFFTAEDYAVILKDGTIIKHHPGDDPREQVRWNAGRLERYLDENGIADIKIKKALIFSEQDSMRFLGSPSVYLIDNKDSLKHYFESNTNDPRFSVEFCNKITTVLEK